MNLRTAFEEADELAGAQRAEYLRSLAQKAPELHSQVAALLSASEGAAGFLRCVGESETAAGERVGPFLVLGELGRGGFSLVQRARQEAPVQREVALKRLRGAAGAPAVIARFAAERQTLASLSHPHIARFFDAGADAQGQPWFAMELVEGVPITTFVKEQRLPRREVIRLFLTICQAITHAHRKGVIHRDLKPSNLLVDATGHAWVIDFGISKLLDPLTDDTAELTLAGQMIGTPLYMAPERFEGVSDTRADVYALGILLAELLTGRLLRQAATFWKLGPHAWARHLRETPPPPLRLDGDLDAILLKAIEAEPALRYGSVQEFADDLLAWLEDEPVRARPPSLWLYARKFVRRHRLVFAAAVVALAGLVAGLISALHSAAVARQGRVTAEAARDRAAAVASALSLLISSSNPEVSEGKPAPTMAEALDQFSANLPRIVNRSPQIEQDVRLVLGEAWLGQGRVEKAEAEFRQAAVLEKATGSRLGEAWQNLAVVAIRRNELEKAAVILAQPEANPAAGITADPLNWMLNLCLSAHLARHNGHLAAARQQIDEAIKMIAREHFEVTQPESAAKAWRALAWLEHEEHNFPAAERAALEMVRLQELAAGSQSSMPLAEARGILAEAILAQRQDSAALQMLEQSWKAFVSQYGAGHSYAISRRLALATHLRSAGRLAEALVHARASAEAAAALPVINSERDTQMRIAGELIIAIEQGLLPSN